MSRQLAKDAHLEGYNGPLLDLDMMGRLMDAFDMIQPNAIIPEGIAKPILGFRPANSSEQRPTTSDGYVWYGAIYFNLKNGAEIAILYPWSQDKEQKDGSMADRQIAVYVKKFERIPAPSIAEIEDTVRQLCTNAEIALA